MTLKQALKKLESLGDEKTRAFNEKRGAPDNQYGVKKGDLRKIAKEIKSDHALGLQLWDTENLDARCLAILIMKPKELSAKEVEEMVRSETFPDTADWLTNYIVKKHPEKDVFREKWMNAKDKMLARSAWWLTSDIAMKDPESLDVPAVLNRLETEMGKAQPEVQWTMNFTLSYLGIHHEKSRKRAIAIGEKHGLYRDFPVPRGCTSPYAPVWIDEMVKRAG